MIRQIYSENKTVQTDLCVEVDGVFVYYRLLKHFAYEFTVMIGGQCPCKDAKKAREIVYQVIQAMVDQSCEHGFRWCPAEMKEDIVDGQYKGYICTVNFRIADIEFD